MHVRAQNQECGKGVLVTAVLRGLQALNDNASQLAAAMSASERHRVLEHVHEFARDLIMQLEVLGLGMPPGVPP